MIAIEIREPGGPEVLIPVERPRLLMRLPSTGSWNRDPTSGRSSLLSASGTVAGREITVHYTGWLDDGQSPAHRGRRFDSSRNRNEPFTFRLGAGEVIRGRDQAVAGMKVGGLRTLVIPSELGYGRRGAPGIILPNATLVFDVELLDVK